ncbi:hypothetical protein ZYGR_0N06610 [Zygosaccharomyces rouxii]|uniref:Tethering factor for nuclear proteasome STS1 n=2 Tax=Zygosaccharomyces rouxii TaxID=4956 RepID=STS1_ZYGRC|nr:uncharacterized protein ZYRO0D15488g [Zygosaccharomyces rouxii]C5DWK1.1 RecName: Full=Tethering factor for nuclear proteasome STS1 [Zygosaccharomyces rouxii CBS 732]KAH9201080.1 tethering factor for nuclear proteasome STS1 [Zygosaccharomyces rouxii]GAV49254.1 hypothetical protein ZYGR_0N06610 [Zygosaccharomyces rouxii]CAR28170.1 ZYRO0D15488p [Zygosaccharomyces rouxii]
MENNTAVLGAGFSWGFKSDNVMKCQEQEEQQARENEKSLNSMVANLVQAQGMDPKGRKRRLDEPTNPQPQMMVPPRKYNVSKRRPHHSTISGQPLPLHRGLELMSKDQLQYILIEVMKNYPISQQLVQNKLVDFNFSIEKCEILLKEKLQQLHESIPYSRSHDYQRLSDYAFVRMKPHILEFLNCLVDCVLDRIPPRVDNLHESLKILDMTTDMVTKLPRFQLASNNYYYDKCLEQLACLWCTVIEHIARDVIMTVNDAPLLRNWIQKLELYNELCHGILTKPLNQFKSLAVVDAGVTDSNSTKGTNATRNRWSGSTDNYTVGDNQ